MCLCVKNKVKEFSLSLHSMRKNHEKNNSRVFTFFGTVFCKQSDKYIPPCL